MLWDITVSGVHGRCPNIMVSTHRSMYGVKLIWKLCNAFYMPTIRRKATSKNNYLEFITTD